MLISPIYLCQWVKYSCNTVIDVLTVVANKTVYCFRGRPNACGALLSQTGFFGPCVFSATQEYYERCLIDACSDEENDDVINLVHGKTIFLL